MLTKQFVKSSAIPRTVFPVKHVRHQNTRVPPTLSTLADNGPTSTVRENVSSSCGPTKADICPRAKISDFTPDRALFHFSLPLLPTFAPQACSEPSRMVPFAKKNHRSCRTLPETRCVCVCTCALLRACAHTVNIHLCIICFDVANEGPRCPPRTSSNATQVLERTSCRAGSRSCLSHAVKGPAATQVTATRKAQAP